MSHRILGIVAAASCLLFPLSNSGFGQGTAFTYQGRLADNGSPANGTYDFRLRLALDPLGNIYFGTPCLTNGVPIANGLFTVTLDFGSAFLSGSNFWLEIDVRTNGNGNYTVLQPLQALTAAPYATMANTASNLLGMISAAQVSGTMTLAQLPAGLVTNGSTGITLSGSFTGNGSGLTNLTAPVGYLFAIANSGIGSAPQYYQTNILNGTNILFNLTHLSNGWTSTSSASGTSFIALNAGVYMLQYQVYLVTSAGDPDMLAPVFQATLNGVGIPDSLGFGQYNNATQSPTFLVAINAGDVLAIQCIASPNPVTFMSLGRGHWASVTAVRLQ